MSNSTMMTKELWPGVDHWYGSNNHPKPTIDMGTDALLTINFKDSDAHKYFALGVEPSEGRTYKLVCSSLSCSPDGYFTSKFKLV